MPSIDGKRSIREWIDTLPQIEKELAIYNYEQRISSLSDFDSATLDLIRTNDPLYAIMSAFSWVNSPQGHDYWQRVSGDIASRVADRAEELIGVEGSRIDPIGNKRRLIG